MSGTPGIWVLGNKVTPRSSYWAAWKTRWYLNLYFNMQCKYIYGTSNYCTVTLYYSQNLKPRKFFPPGKPLCFQSHFSQWDYIIIFSFLLYLLGAPHPPYPGRTSSSQWPRPHPRGALRDASYTLSPTSTTLWYNTTALSIQQRK